MNIVRACVRNPVTTLVGVILAVLFGAISLFRIPVQMIPTVDRPVISVRTNYDGAAPLEVEEEITKRLEERLTSVEGMVEMNSDSREGRSSITLEFDWGTNKDIARLDVAEKLGRVRNIPDDADRPLIRAVNSDERQPIAWFTLVTNRKINEIRTEMFDVVLPKLERVPGVGDVRMWGGEAREVRVTLDYPAMSARGVTVGDLRMERNLQDTWALGLGAEYALNPELQLRGATWYESSSMSDATMSPVTPDTEKAGLALGAAVSLERWLDGLWLDVAAGYLHMRDRDIPQGTNQVYRLEALRPALSPCEDPEQLGAGCPVPLGDGKYELGTPFAGLGLRWLLDAPESGPVPVEDSPMPDWTAGASSP